MERAVVGLYDDLATARRVVDDLINNGFNRANISLMANDASNEYAKYVKVPSTPVHTEDEDAVKAGQGAGFGAVVGAIVGALAAVGALAIPGIGPVIAAGPLAGTLGALGGAVIGAGAGAVTGGVTAALVKTGISDTEAQYYAEGVRRGGTLVVVHTDDSTYKRAESILGKYSPVDIGARVQDWTKSGWKGFDETAQPFKVAPITTTTRTTASASTIPTNTYAAFDTFNQDFRNDYMTSYSKSGYTYDQYLPIYRYGYDLATNERYLNSDWDTIETDARRTWEERNPGNAWDKFKNAVHYAWDRVRGKQPAGTR